jgi:ABC-type transport system involved in cytochrome c biogenesis permease component
VWSIVSRELRVQARQPSSAMLRSLGAAAVLVAFAVGWKLPVMQFQSDGRGLFTLMNHVMIVLIWLVAPVLTADCISRERREGTLGLLFLTPLRAIDVVVGKAFAHAWRAFTVVLASIPVLALPIMLGGLTVWDVMRMLLLHLAVLGLSLTAGLLASSWATTWVLARLLAFALATGAGASFAGLYCAFSAVHHWQVLQRIHPGLQFHQAWLGQMWGWCARLGFASTDRFGGLASFWMPIAGSGGNPASVWLAFKVFLAALALVGVAVAIASISVRNSWLPAEASWFSRWLHLDSGSIRAAQALQGQRNRALDSNPVRWLQTRTWSGRWVRWGWLGLGAVAASGLLVPQATPLLLMCGVVSAIGYGACISFRREREEGALELWLVTELTPERILTGRLLGLANQFFPVMAMVSCLIPWRLLPGTPGAMPWVVVVSSWFAWMGWLAGASGLGLLVSTLSRPRAWQALAVALIPALLMFAVQSLCEQASAVQPGMAVWAALAVVLGGGLLFFHGFRTARHQLENRCFLGP